MCLRLLLVHCIVLLATAETVAQEIYSDNAEVMQLSPDTRAAFRNPDGSCVQCSIGMVGVHCNDIKATMLLWDSEYGKAVRGGSWPDRVASYCDARGIQAWNVTGESTIDWCKWAAKTGRFAAIGAGRQHFQTLYGYDPDNKDKSGRAAPWLVCNNNSTHRVDAYTEDGFRQLHYASGKWVVVLKKSSSENPVVVNWWEQ